MDLITWFKKIFHICDHEWKKLDVVSVYSKDLAGSISEYPIYRIHTYECMKCATLKKHKV